METVKYLQLSAEYKPSSNTEQNLLQMAAYSRGTLVQLVRKKSKNYFEITFSR